MGRHKDPDTIAFIDWVDKKGIELGYQSETEYSIGNGEFFIDVIWKYFECPDPFITFEVETSNSGAIFKNTMKIFSTKQSLVKKPFRHFMIVLKNSLSQGQIDSLHLFLDHYNISLYDNLLNDADKVRRFKDEINNLLLNPNAEKTPLLLFFRSYLGFILSDLEYALSKFGQNLPFLLADDFRQKQEHNYEKIPDMIEHLRSRISQIKSINQIKIEDLEELLEMTKLVERIDAKESSLLSQGICPKCGSKLTQKQIYHGGSVYDEEPYAVTYIDGCESCDYELNRETIDL